MEGKERGKEMEKKEGGRRVDICSSKEGKSLRTNKLCTNMSSHTETHACVHIWTL